MNNFVQPMLSDNGELDNSTWVIAKNTKCKYVSYCPYLEKGFGRRVIANSMIFENVFNLNDKTNKIQELSQCVFKAYLNGKLVKRFRIKKHRKDNNLRLKFEGGLLLDVIKIDFIKFYS